MENKTKANTKQTKKTAAEMHQNQLIEVAVRDTTNSAQLCSNKQNDVWCYLFFLEEKIIYVNKKKAIER